MLLNILSSLVLAQLTVAQYGGYGGGNSDSSSPTNSAAASAPSAPADTPGVHNVNVSPNGAFVFDPAAITAQVGEIVTFWFPESPFPHSVTQSSFAAPCTYLAANGSNSAGFDSGLQTAKKFSINITDTRPIWFHCKQILHCGMGMVGSINAPSDGNNTHEAYVAAARAIGNNEVTEQDSGTPVLSGLGAVATEGPTDSRVAASGAATRSVVEGSFYVVVIGLVSYLLK